MNDASGMMLSVHRASKVPALLLFCFPALLLLMVLIYQSQNDNNMNKGVNQCCEMLLVNGIVDLYAAMLRMQVQN